jgi:AraC family ethanolamine operon transcriptional activator
MDKGSVMVLEPGVEFCMAASCANRWSSIFVPYDQLSALNVPGTEINRKHRVLSPTAAGERLHRLAENLGSVCQNVSDAACSASAIAAAQRRIAEAACEALGFQNEVAASSGRQTLSRAQITRTALQILEEYPDEHFSVNRLSTMVGVSERTLRTAFEEYFGVGPTRYLKIRTLHQARNLLKRADPYTTSVTEIAVGLGIWELGRLSHDYKVLFDELPSGTLWSKYGSKRTNSSRPVRPPPDR